MGSSLRYWLWSERGRFALNSGETLIGRDAVCAVVINDPLVSRRHAAIEVVEGDVRIKDLGSSNGVFVNGSQVAGEVSLSDGDTILIGRHMMRITAEVATGTRDSPTLHGYQRTSEDAQLSSNPPTEQVGALEVLRAVCDKLAAAGRVEDTERVVRSQLLRVLDGARSGRQLPKEVVSEAISLSLQLARWTGKGEWVDYLFEMARLSHRLLEGWLVDTLYDVVRETTRCDVSQLRKYLDQLGLDSSRFGPNERFVVQRLEGLERVMSNLR